MWKADRSFDPIEEEANHLFVTRVISVADFKLGFGDGLLSIDMPGHLRLGENRVDTMNGCTTDTWDVTSILCFHRCIAEVINIDLQ